MNIMYLSHLSDITGGSVKALRTIAVQIKNHGNNVLVVFPDNGEATIEFRKIGINVKIIPYYSSIYPPSCGKCKSLLSFCKLIRNIIYNIVAIVRLIFTIRDFDADIVHTNVGTLNVGFYASRITRKPHVWHIREMAEVSIGWKPFPCLYYKKKLFSKNTYNIAITREVYNFYKLNWNNSKVVYDGVVNVNDIKEIKLPKENYFLYVGNLSKSKGVEFILDAFERMFEDRREIDYKLLLAGKGSNEYEAYLRKKYKDLIERGRVVFLGFRKDVASLMKNATALLVGSNNEGFGFTTVEAMFNGCLVIGKDSGGTKEQFDNGKDLCGHEVALRCNTNQEMTNKFVEVISCGIKSYLEMIEEAQKTVIKLYTIDNNINEINRIYNIIDKHGEQYANKNSSD